MGYSSTIHNSITIEQRFLGQRMTGKMTGKMTERTNKNRQ